MQLTTRKRLRNTLLNWRWWVILPLVVPVLIVAFLIDLLKLFARFIDDHHEAWADFIVFPFGWVRRHRKYQDD